MERSPRAFLVPDSPEKEAKAQRKLEAGLECVPILHFVVLLLVFFFNLDFSFPPNHTDFS